MKHDMYKCSTYWCEIPYLVNTRDLKANEKLVFLKPKVAKQSVVAQAVKRAADGTSSGTPAASKRRK